MTHIYLELLACVQFVVHSKHFFYSPMTICHVHKKCAKSCKQSQFTAKFIATSVRDNFKQSNHSRLHVGLENKSGQIFGVWQVYFTKSCQKIWVPVNQPFTLFIHHIWGDRVLWGADLRQNAVFHNFSRQTAFIQCSGPSRHAYAFSETSQKISKITYTASQFSLLTSAKFAVNIKRVTLQYNKEFWC